MDILSDTIERRRTNSIKPIILSIVGPLIVTVILGYVAMYTTISKLTLLAEHADKRILAMEQSTKDYEKSSREMQLILAKHAQMLETLYSDFIDIKRRAK